MRLKAFLLLSFVLGLSSAACAQATSASHLTWDQDGASVADVQSYTYKGYADSNTTGTVEPAANCVVNTTFYTCSIVFPSFSTGNHTLALTATNAGGESLKSTPLTFSYTGLPGTPRNLRITEYINYLHMKQKQFHG